MIHVIIQNLQIFKRCHRIMFFNFQVITLTSTICFSSHISYPSASEAMDDPDAVEADPVPEADVEASHDDHVDPNVEAEAEDAPEAR